MSWQARKRRARMYRKASRVNRKNVRTRSKAYKRKTRADAKGGVSWGGAIALLLLGVAVTGGTIAYVNNRKKVKAASNGTKQLTAAPGL